MRSKTLSCMTAVMRSHATIQRTSPWLLYTTMLSPSSSSWFRLLLPQQRRNTTTTSSSTSSTCPFTILGVRGPSRSSSSSSFEHQSNAISYSQVKAAFIQLALKHHPDRGGMADEFRRIRRAFESIKELSDGTCVVVPQDPGEPRQGYHDDDDEDGGNAWYRDNKKNKNHDSLSDWFYHETGTRLSFHMDSATRREVATVVTTMSQGGLDKGGIWDMARMIAREEANNPSRDDPKQLEGGTTALLKRRRKR